MYYTVYKITNLVNGKIYVGVNKTNDLNNYYMGSGKLIKEAIKKYGLTNFKKEIIAIFDNTDDMFEMEAQIVNEEFVKDSQTYNLKEGGHGGWDHIIPEHFTKSENRKISQPLNSKKATEAIKWLYENDKDWVESQIKKLSEGMIKYYENGGKNGFYGKNHSDETIEKMKGHTSQKGEKNSQFGTLWIHNIELKKSKKIKKEEFPTWEQEGWLKGRKMKF